jgi:hypothetical protein
MKHLNLAIIALIGGFVLTGNAAAPKSSGYLSDYHRLIEGEYLEAYWVDVAHIERTRSPSMLLGEISTVGIKGHKGVTVADCVGWLERELLNGAMISNRQAATYRLDLAITHMDPGSAAKRLWAGEFGAGHAQLQIEGKVVEIESGAVVAAFAERRRSSGALGAQDLAGDAGPHIIEHLVSLISADVKSELLATFSSRK